MFGQANNLAYYTYALNITYTPNAHYSLPSAVVSSYFTAIRRFADHNYNTKGKKRN